VWRVERTQSHMGSCRHRSVLGYVEGEGEAAFLVLVSSRSFVRSSLYHSHKHTIQNNHYDSLDEHLPLIYEVNQIYCLAVSTNNDDQSVKVIV